MGLLEPALTLTRLDGWPERLAVVIEAARARPYVIGEHDCMRVACAAVEAITGVDFWPRFSGYRTHREAWLAIRRVAPTLGEAVTATLGEPPGPMPGAMRGDVALFRDPKGQDHLGVVIGRDVMLTAEEGTVRLPLDHPGLLGAWRIG